LAALLAVLLVALAAHSCCAVRIMKKEVAAAKRDPITGIVLGTEAITLPPPEGRALSPSTACLFIHGFMAARDCFADLGETMAAEGMTVRMMRLPGHGTTPSDLAIQPPDAEWNAVLAEYRALRASHERVYVVGFSMGGTLATLLAEREEVDGLVLLAPFYRVRWYWYYALPPEWWNWMARGFVSYVTKPKDFAHIKDKSQIPNFYFYRTTPLEAVARLIGFASEAVDPESLARIQCPTLFIHAREDSTASPGAARKVFERMGAPAKEWVWLENSDHIICWDFDREIVKEKTREFLLRGETE
jgi:carboxylesterase